MNFRRPFITLACVCVGLHLFAQLPSNCTGLSAPSVLLAGDSWAQFIGDDGSYDDVFRRYGHADQRLVTETTTVTFGNSYSGNAYAVSGSEARQWADTSNFSFLQNMLGALQLHPPCKR